MKILVIRLFVFCLGLPLIAFYGVLLLAAVINLPDSWIGFLYSIAGITAGILCIVFFFKQNYIFFIMIIPAIIAMILTIAH
jgi:hypothetical protein